MRLILLNSTLDIPNVSEFPNDTYAFVCIEDFSVGPLENWQYPEKFREGRNDFWKKSTRYDLPDGSQMEYFVWSQYLPRYDIVELVKNGTDIDEIPENHEFEDLVLKAETIEIWRGQSVCDIVWNWYVIAQLSRLGVRRQSVSLCLLPEQSHSEMKTTSWWDMLLDLPTRRISPKPITRSDWQTFQTYWQAVITSQTIQDGTPIQPANAETQHVFSILAGRLPDPETGLTNLHARILQSSRLGWSKMARVIGNAMAEGFDKNDVVGDCALHVQLLEMSRADPPLLEVKGSGPIRFCQVRLTADGAQKLQLISGRSG